jgi:hypothetical protein
MDSENDYSLLLPIEDNKDIKGTRRNVIHNGELVPGIEREDGTIVDTVTGERMPTATIAPSQKEIAEVVGFGTPEQKRFNQRVDAHINTVKGVDGMRELSKMLANPKTQIGWTGDIIQNVNSITGAWKQMTGDAESVVGSNGEIDLSKIDPESHAMSWLQSRGARSGAYEAALFELAYVKAKAVGNQRITDKDFEFAKKMLAGSGDKVAVLHNLELQIRRTVRNYNLDEKVFGDRHDKYKPRFIGKFDPETSDMEQGFGSVDSAASPEDAAAGYLKGMGIVF